MSWQDDTFILRPRQNGRHFPEDIFKCIFLNENVKISIKISLKFVPKGPINNIPALVQIMAWRRPGDKPLPESMMGSLLTHICVARPQWIKCPTSIMMPPGLFHLNLFNNCHPINSQSDTMILKVTQYFSRTCQLFWMTSLYPSHNEVVGRVLVYSKNPCAWLLWHWSSRGQLALRNPQGR